MEDAWHKPETSKALNRRSSGPISEGIATIIKSAVAGGVLAIPARSIIPEYVPRSEQIGLYAAYAILALAYLHWKKAKEILSAREPDKPAKIIGIVLINLFLAGFATLALMVPLAFLFNLSFWDDTDKKCALTLAFFCLPIGSLLLLAT
jgi:hypothetical protein